MLCLLAVVLLTVASSCKAEVRREAKRNETLAEIIARCPERSFRKFAYVASNNSHFIVTDRLFSGKLLAIESEEPLPLVEAKAVQNVAKAKEAFQPLCAQDRNGQRLGDAQMWHNAGYYIDLYRIRADESSGKQRRRLIELLVIDDVGRSYSTLRRLGLCDTSVQKRRFYSAKLAHLVAGSQFDQQVCVFAHRFIVFLDQKRTRALLLDVDLLVLRQPELLRAVSLSTASTTKSNRRLGASSYKTTTTTTTRKTTVLPARITEATRRSNWNSTSLPPLTSTSTWTTSQAKSVTTLHYSVASKHRIQIHNATLATESAITRQISTHRSTEPTSKTVEEITKTEASTTLQVNTNSTASTQLHKASLEKIDDSNSSAKQKHTKSSAVQSEIAKDYVLSPPRSTANRLFGDRIRCTLAYLAIYAALNRILLLTL